MDGEGGQEKIEPGDDEPCAREGAFTSLKKTKKKPDAEIHVHNVHKLDA